MTDPRLRTARIRGRAAQARPRITYPQLAERADLATGTVRNVLSDNAPWDVTDALDKLEAALDSLESERAQEVVVPAETEDQEA